MADSKLPTPAVIAGLVVGIAFVVIFAFLSVPQPLQSLELVLGNYTTEEEIAENNRIFAAYENYPIVKDAISKYGRFEDNSTWGGQIDRSPQTLQKFNHIDDVKAVVQFIVIKGLYLGEGDRGVKITMVIDSDYMPVITYVKCLKSEADAISPDIGRISSTIGCA